MQPSPGPTPEHLAAQRHAFELMPAVVFALHVMPGIVAATVAIRLATWSGKSQLVERVFDPLVFGRSVFIGAAAAAMALGVVMLAAVRRLNLVTMAVAVVFGLPFGAGLGVLMVLARALLSLESRP